MDNLENRENRETRENRVGPVRCRGIRGATTVTDNTAEGILEATREVLTGIVERNQVDIEDITSVFFTVTEDLDAEHPALAARQLGWESVALMCAREIPVPGSLQRCIRVLLHVNTAKSPGELRHVYLREAAALRPGWAESQPSFAASHRDSTAKGVSLA
jgi:chorismate mutase